MKKFGIRSLLLVGIVAYAIVARSDNKSNENIYPDSLFGIKLLSKYNGELMEKHYSPSRNTYVFRLPNTNECDESGKYHQIFIHVSKERKILGVSDLLEYSAQNSPDETKISWKEYNHKAIENTFNDAVYAAEQKYHKKAEVSEDSEYEKSVCFNFYRKKAQLEAGNANRLMISVFYPYKDKAVYGILTTLVVGPAIYARHIGLDDNKSVTENDSAHNLIPEEKEYFIWMSILIVTTLLLLLFHVWQVGGKIFLKQHGRKPTIGEHFAYFFIGLATLFVTVKVINKIFKD